MGSLSQLSNKLLVVIDCDQVHSQSADSSSIASPSPLGVKARGACVDIFSLFSCFILSLCFFFFFFFPPHMFPGLLNIVWSLGEY